MLKRPGILKTLLLFIILVSAAILFGMAAFDRSGTYDEIYSLQSNESDPMLFASIQDGSLFVINDITAVALLVNSSGEVEARHNFSAPLLKAVIRGENLFTFSSENSMICLQKFDSALNLSKTAYLDVDYELISFIDCDSQGNFYFTLHDRPTRVQIHTASGDFEQQIRVDSDISFIEVSRNDFLYIFTNEMLYYADTQNLDDIVGKDSSFFPALLLNDNYFLTVDGKVCDMSANTVAPVLSTSTIVSAPLFYCLDSEFCLIWSNGQSQIYRSDLNGNNAENFTANGNLLAVNSNGLIVEKDGKIYHSLFSSFDDDVTNSESSVSESSAESSSTPEPPLSDEFPEISSSEPSEQSENSELSTPSPSPTATPTPPPEDYFKFEPYLKGNLIYLKAGTTVTELKALFYPQEIQIYKSSGESVYSGLIGTGMTVDEYSIVIPGDCNENGTVTITDIREAQKLLLGFSVRNQCNFYAVDFDDDGVISMLDLITLSKMVG